MRSLTWTTLGLACVFRVVYCDSTCRAQFATPSGGKRADDVRAPAMEPKVAPYGSWDSPITSDLIVAATIRLGAVALGKDGIFWLEGRPTEGGRNVLVHRSSNGDVKDITPESFNVRTRVHEYGGGAYMVVEDTVYFSNFMDQRVYRQPVSSMPSPLTPEGNNMRYADYIFDSARDSLICVREDHNKGDQDAEATIVRLNAQEGEPLDSGEVLVSGHDFFSSPRLSPDGGRLAWLCWNHPNMPWDGTELWVASINADGSLSDKQKVAGGVDESIFQPEWSPDGTLYFISDRTNWWNLYRWRGGKIESLHEKDAEFGSPQWVFGMCTYGFESPESLICTYTGDNGTQVARLNTTSLAFEELEVPFAQIGGIRVSPTRTAFLGASPTSPSAVIDMDLATKDFKVIQKSADIDIDPGYISVPESIEFPTENGKTAFGYYYPPQNQDFEAEAGEKPPLLVKSHGGPTGATSPAFSLSIQYWTSRGIAVFDVNYGGSTGYGREYRNRLRGEWGVVDVDDCVNGALHLAREGKADGDRLLIDGGSAGGFTTLCALTFRDAMKAGASHYGVSDLRILAQDTHKFESHYLDLLVGPYPETEEIYKERSPIFHTDKLSVPVAFFQGTEDKVVPPNQAQMMFDALKEKGLPVSLTMFEGEQHGFRKAENIKAALDGELYFYSKVCGFELAGDIQEVTIENL